MYHFTQDASLWHMWEQKRWHQQIPPYVDFWLLIPFPWRFPLFPGRIFIFFCFLIIIIFTHVFCLSIFGSFSWERLIHSDSPALFLLLFFCLTEHELSFNEQLLSWSAKNTHRSAQRDISTHISDLQIILFVFVFFSAKKISSNIWIKTSSRIWRIWSGCTWIRINCLSSLMTCLIDRRVLNFSVRLNWIQNSFKFSYDNVCQLFTFP